MASFLLQVTLLDAAATQASASKIPCRMAILQNNTAHALRFGDATVTASRGIAIADDGGSVALGVAAGALEAVDLSEIYFYGTADDVIDIWYAG